MWFDHKRGLTTRESTATRQFRMPIAGYISPFTIPFLALLPNESPSTETHSASSDPLPALASRRLHLHSFRRCCLAARRIWRANGAVSQRV